MKSLKNKLFYFASLLCLFLYLPSYAQSTYDWTGLAGNNNWKTAGNWQVGGVTATAYPGKNSNTDKVQFGVSYFYAFATRPILSSADSISITSLTIGDNSNTNNVETDLYIDIEGKLNVIGTILQTHSNNIGFVGNGTLAYPSGYNYHIQTFFYGAGKVYCTTFQIGDNTTPLVTGINNITRFNIGDPNSTAGKGLTTVVSGDFIVNSVTSNDAATKIISVNNANVGLCGGVLTIAGQLKLTNTGTINYTTTQFQPQARFTLQVRNNGTTTNTILYLQGAHALYCQPKDPTTNQVGSDYFDFCLVGNNPLTNLGTTTVVYSGNVDQEVYTSGSFTQANTILDNNGGNYQNLKFSGSGKKTIDATPNASFPLYISGDMTLAAGTENVDLSTNNPTVVFSNGSNFTYQFYGGSSYATSYVMPGVSNFSSTANTTFQNGSVALTIPGTTTNGGTFNTSASNGLTFTGAFTNSGTFNQSGAGVVTASNTTSNSGTYNQSGSGTLTFTGTVANSGTINDSNTGAITFNNTFNNSATPSVFNQSAGTINFNNSYTNSGTFKATAGTVNINQSGAQSLTDNSAADKGTIFFTVNIKNGGTKTLSGSGAGQFYIASQGTLNMLASTTLAANGFLTLFSDANGAATVTAIPAGCSITGNVDVQRFVSAHRAYRLVSSPVYTATTGNGNIYSLNYLLTNTYLTGPGAGFDKSGNPSLYLFRENLAPQYSSFLNSNFRGISDISAAPDYSISGDAGSYNIPVGNGYLFYFRGSRKQASLATLTTAGAAATTDTLNAVGILNQGSITVHNWYTPASANLGFTTISCDQNIEGMNLIGNPYASSIDWDKSDSTNASAAIYRPHTAPFSYQLVPTGAQGSGNYNVYQAGSGGVGTQGTPNSNIIASGEGFFIQATGSSAAVTFTESAKTNTLVTGANLYMGKPVEASVPQFMRLQMALDSVNTDGIIISFNGGSKTAFDASEDARYKVGTGKVSLSSLSSDNIALAINQLPLSQGLIIPLKVSATAGGKYTLNMQSLTGIPQVYDIWLKDAFTKDSVNMRTNASYSFTINTSDTTTFGSRRFSIVMQEDPALAYKPLSFAAEKVADKSQVQLVWKTQNEANYTHFTIERSADNGKTFEVVGGMTSSGQGTYSLQDKNPVKGENLYRLKQEDLNNTVTYSNVIDINFTGTIGIVHENISVFPNPASGIINLAINTKSADAAVYSIRVTNSAGFVVKEAISTQPNWQANVSNLYAGSYVVQVINNKDNSVVGKTKFIKL